MLVWSTALLLLLSVPIRGLGDDFDWCSHDCPPTYPLKKVEKHTMCIHKEGGGAACQGYRMGFSQEEKDYIVDQHNQMRATVANGEEKRGAGGAQPSAADMMELVWDDEVAMIAQRWADQCTMGGHDKCRQTMDRVPAGQNVAAMSGYGKTIDRKSSVTELINSWYNEVEDNVPSDVDSAFRSSVKDTGHYTQLVWADTRRVGCGMAQLSGYSFAIKIVCNYKGAGNYGGSRIYTRGQPASKCPKNSEPSTKYPGLCKSTGNDVFEPPTATMDDMLQTVPSDLQTMFPLGQLQQSGMPMTSVPAGVFKIPMTSVASGKPLTLSDLHQLHPFNQIQQSGTSAGAGRPLTAADLFSQIQQSAALQTQPSQVPTPATQVNPTVSVTPIIIPMTIPGTPVQAPVQLPVQEEKKKKPSLFWRIITLPWRFLKWLFGIPIRIFLYLKHKLFD